MGSCTRRHFLLSTCFLQMITIIERQVFDFLGYMWAPIFVNFFHILFIIFGFYGAYHFRIKYIITYLIWNFLWIGWNSFLICFYLNVGTLNRDSELLSLGTGSVSWFEVNGYGCKPTYNTNITSEDPYRPVRPESVEDCLLTYDIVEVVHSGVQCILAFFGILGAILISYIFLDEDDRFDFMNGDAKSPQHTVVHPMYVSYTSIPTSASATMLSQKHHQNHTLRNYHNNTLNNSNNHLSNISTTTTPTATKKQLQAKTTSLLSQQTSLHHKQQQLLTTTATNNSNSHRNSNISNNSNSNTFLIHTHHQNRHRGIAGGVGGGGVVGVGGGQSGLGAREGSFNDSLVSNSSQFQPYNTGSSYQRRKHTQISPSSRSYTPNPSNTSSSLTHMLYSPKSGRKVQPTSTNSIFPANIDLAQKQSSIPGYYDDSTAKADHQLYVNGSRRQMLQTQSPTLDTTPSLSYASLQNSTQNLDSSIRQTSAGQGGNTTPSIGSGVVNPLNSSLSNSNYSLTNSLNNNQPGIGVSHNSNSGHFARIHSKPKPPKSSSYSSFKHANSLASTAGMATPQQRPDIKYSQIFNESTNTNTSNQFDESFEDDNFSMHNLKTDEGVTYVPFTKPTPGNYFLTPSSTQVGALNGENNNTYNSIQSQNSLNNNSHNNHISPNNNSHAPLQYHDNSGILLEHGAILQQPLTPYELNPAQRIIYQQNGLPFHPAYSPTPYRQNSACPAQKQQPTRPTNIPLPTIPSTYEPQQTPAEFLSPSEVTPPPPPHPRPHIFQPRTGTAPYPDLSPEVTERYAMPTQYIPRSPVASRIARRQRQQNSSHHNDRSQLPLNSSANFCDQIRDTPPGYVAGDNSSLHTYTISKARSHDRLSSAQSANGSFKEKDRSNSNSSSSGNGNNRETSQQQQQGKDLAPHVNRRSGRRDGGKIRPRSYCNSMSGGEGVIRVNISNDRNLGYAA